jgi:uncharacterized damage-inducible protein DinB
MRTAAAGSELRFTPDRQVCDHRRMTWTAPEVSLPDGPLTGEERPMLEGFLAWHRALLQHKCAGLTGEQLALCSTPPSNLSLLGLVRHMAKVERRWFRERIGGEELEPMYDEATLGKDADFEDLDPARAQADYERLVEECRLAQEALDKASYDDTVTSRMGEMSVRAVVIHMVEEYAQHNGHADLLREAIDGKTDK